MKPVKVVFLALAILVFLLALVMHTASLLGPERLLPPGLDISPDSMIIVSAAILIGSIVTWFAGYFMTDLQRPDQKPEGAGGGDWLTGLGMIIQLVLSTPLWLNLIFFGFLGYLIAASLLIPTSSDELTTRLKIFGAICSGLNLHAIILLSASKQAAHQESLGAE